MSGHESRFQKTEHVTQGFCSNRCPWSDFARGGHAPRQANGRKHGPIRHQQPRVSLARPCRCHCYPPSQRSTLFIICLSIDAFLLSRYIQAYFCHDAAPLPTVSGHAFICRTREPPQGQHILTEGKSCPCWALQVLSKHCGLPSFGTFIHAGHAETMAFMCKIRADLSAYEVCHSHRVAMSRYMVGFTCLFKDASSLTIVANLSSGCEDTNNMQKRWAASGRHEHPGSDPVD